ncbi:SDR family NAD(P)-dependent oxidoreductase [Candidatus Laterigemmans baculatus]|uniref:SDR family NAD(P)-dependent oxidoreductase n=1 Tax=Candidatus Laterigemmans baculatus TaxID=2770505 RepID=UPI0013DD5DE5|nr:SDR family NAD(P)-dependent oxidoreductase [Candidatus Laterigemmans baculatus]
MVRWKAQQSVAVVTGASSGIGYHLSRLLAERGARVVAVARRRERLDQLRSATAAASGSVIAYPGDVTDPEVRRGLLARAAEIAEGRLDLLVNNAGIGALGPFAEASPERLRRIMEVNFFAPVELTRLALPMLRLGRQPVLCNLGSVLGHRAVPDKSEYCASKFALHGWSDSLRAELRESGIQVTLVSPSTTESEFFDAVIETPEGQVSRSLGSWPAERVARATLSAILARRAEVILSLGGKALVYADRLSPPLMNRLLAR